MSSSGVWDHLALVQGPSETDDANLVVTIAEAMRHCRIVANTGDDWTDWLRDAIVAAQSFFDGPHGAGIALLTQQWRLSLDRWPTTPREIEVPIWPVRSIDQITYRDTAFNTQTLAPTQYVYDLDSNPPFVKPAFAVVWPVLGIIPGNVKVTFTAGFGDQASAVPRDIKQAIKMLVLHFYDNPNAVVGVNNRDSSTILPLGVQAVIDKYAVGRIG